ncbi:amino acid adenylation domain-containing protein [Moritella marina ATCC 15381]|uniref:Amino acid adenylation domain-containing protein n=1 Tax=Moritella marina ATCC 15381 TaxID=1202962 RepID=A0A5J6WKN3_MORMI|nr:amino acid adenylation domain-containing protein [Moritella marina]QFI37801.1 amino acid adenylation domain-containing protein [Moritella marina ATCC 15381]
MTQLKLDCHNGDNIVDLFRNQIEQHGTNTAVSFQDRNITYQQLGEQSLTLALYLQQQGVCLDGCVGLFVDPSIELMVGVWGILQSGAAYLPLAPEYPDDRLKYMLENSLCNIIVVQDELVERLANLVSDEVLLITFSQVTDFFNTKAIPQYHMLTQHAAAHHLAYVIYTSGSTGKPKGVMIEHKSIANQMDWLSTHFSLDCNSVVLQKTPMSFDAAQWEILASCCGARVVMGEPGIYKNPEKLVDTMIQHHVSMLQGVPTLLLALLNVDKFTQCTSLNQIFSGGEALSKHLANELSGQLPDCSIVNLYGPTECTINSSAHVVDIKEMQHSADTISIGKPIPNTQYYILDKDQNPVAAGDIGELYIAGVGLARGYLHREDLTAERFITHIVDGQETGQTLYKTGDLAYWNENGTVQYSGRVDNQVKLRGYRVELDEIKSLIETHDWVNNAAVFLKKDQYTGYQNLISMIELNPREAALMDQGNHDPHHQSKQSRSQVKMQLANSGCRQDAEIMDKSRIDLPGEMATDKQRTLVFSRKSYRFFDGGKIAKADILNVLNSKINYDHYTQLSDLSYADFGQILRHFGQFHSENRLLPKYGYASPGALYATQMYLELDGIGNLTPGYYYYHPVHHQLILITEKERAEKKDPGKVQFKVHFVGKKSAIEPIYKNNILEVLEMEAGHMVGFFENILPTYGLSIKSGDYLPHTMQLFDVAENDYYLGSFNIVSGTKDVMNDDVSLYLQSHPGQVSDLKAGKYLFENGALEYVSSELILKKHVIAINQSVYERASFGISVISTTDEDWLGYINLGRKLQSLQMNDFNIGFMSSGYSSKTGNNLPSAKRIQHILNKDVGPSYFFIGGLISDMQIRSDGMNEDLVHMKGPSEIINDDLLKFLPTYMMPNTIKVIDKMPLTVNGKIDMNALLALETDCISEEHVEPANDVERVVLDIWQKGLNRYSISVNTDFFELGGNSLLAVSIINKINTTLHCDLPLQILFSSPTIQKLAQAVNQIEDNSASRLVPFQVKGKGSPIYCWPGLGGYCMNLRLLSEKVGTDRDFFGVQAYGINVGEIPYQTITEMAAKDVAMIKQNQGKGPYTLWGYSFGARVAFEACYQLEKAGDVVENLYLIAPGSPKVADEDNSTEGYSIENSEATFTNKKFLTILYSVFMGTIKSNSLEECLSVVDTKDKFIHFICRLNNQLETGLVMRIIDIVTMTFEFNYSFHELRQRQLKAPIKIIKATGDDYSFIENNNVFSITKPVIENIEANHYTMLKTTHIDQLVAVL